MPCAVLPQSCFAVDGGKLNLQETVYAEGYGVYNNKIPKTVQSRLARK
ncbi:MAG: hypothetical protein ACLR56_13550 [Oscillospiraceae bacterium]